MNDLSGQSLGRYHLIEKLGEGGMAVVYKAFDTRLECEVAVKIIRMERLTQEMMATTLKRFEREAKAVAQLTHANIVNVTDYGEHDGVPYLVMKYLPGGTLKQFLGRPMPYQQAAALLAPVTRALQYAHSHNIIHRDVKPSNILITESGEPMLTDFGIAKILDLQEGQTLTGTGVGIGTPEYMAPEQWTGQITPAVDIYSLGVVFYELVTGHKPYTADTPAAVLIKSVNDPLPRPSSFVEGLPKQVEQVLFKALAKKPEDRYASMLEFEKALQGLSAGIPTEPKQWKTSEANPVEESPTTDTAATYYLEKPKPQKPIPAVSPASVTPTTDQRSKLSKNTLGWIVGLAGLAVIITLVILSSRGKNLFEPRPTVTPAATNTPLPTSTPELTIGSNQISPKDGMTLMYVPAGNFLMGSPDGVGDNDEHPQHTVYLDAYWIDQTEVTNSMYSKCVAAGACSPPSSDSSYTRSSYYGNLSYNNYPVIHVSWDQADAYCRWVGRRLPTEAQWEKAARGTVGRAYPWGNESPDATLANYESNDTTAVGNYSAGASPYGALDMAGNVWEWVADWYGNYPSENVANPTGPALGDYRVLRGGSWDDNGLSIRSASRSRSYPWYAVDDNGIRCSLSQ